MSQHISQLESELQHSPEAAPKASPSFSVSEKLVRYASTALSTVEHLTLLVAKESIALALMRHFGSLKALSPASLLELRQFVPQQKAEPIIAALSVSAIASPDLFSVQPPFPAWRDIVACWLEAMEMNLSYDMELPNGNMDLGWRPPVWDTYCNLINRTEGKGTPIIVKICLLPWTAVEDVPTIAF